MSANAQAVTPAEQKHAAPVPALLNEIESARILVVDDQPANIQIVGTVLGNLGCEIIPASDGATALKRVALRPPDLILLDLLMPGMGGCEVCRQLKENPDWKDIPVIFLSAADDKDLIVRALDSGGVDYITKPFNQAELISRVRTQLALKGRARPAQTTGRGQGRTARHSRARFEKLSRRHEHERRIDQRADRALQRRTPDAIVGKHDSFERAGAGFRKRISRQLRSGSWFHLEARLPPI